MRQPVSLSYKISKEKSIISDIDETWVDWAIEMMQAGFEADSLRRFAGISKPYNQFGLHDLTSNVLKDLNLDFSDKNKTVGIYAYYLVCNTVDEPEKYLETLRELKNLCIDFNMEEEYKSFYLLYFAKSDLMESEDQWYWEGANRKNIDDIIREQFGAWKDNFEKDKNHITNI